MLLLSALADQFDRFLMILVRVTGMLAATPFFANQAVPVLPKIGFALFLTFFLLPTGVTFPVTLRTADFYTYALTLANELLLGLIMGFLISLNLAVFQIAGQLMDFPMGFGLVNVLDPQFGQQIPILGQFQFVLATLIFLSINGHHYLLQALSRTFELFPPGSWSFKPEMTQFLLAGFAQMFALGFQISLPVVASLFLTDVALGFVARTVPQVNVFIVGFPAKIAIGLISLVIILPLYVSLVQRLFGADAEMFQLLYRLLGAGS